MEVLYVTICFVLVVLGIFIGKKFNSTRIESERKESFKVELEEIKSKNFDKLSINELEDLKEQLHKRLEDTNEFVAKNISTTFNYDNSMWEIKHSYKEIIYDIEELKELKKEIKVRQENNLDFRKFQEDLDWKKSEIKKDVNISKLDKISSEWLYKEEIISEEEFKISLKLYNERVSSKIISQILDIIDSLERLESL